MTERVSDSISRPDLLVHYLDRQSRISCRRDEHQLKKLVFLHITKDGIEKKKFFDFLMMLNVRTYHYDEPSRVLGTSSIIELVLDCVYLKISSQTATEN